MQPRRDHVLFFNFDGVLHPDAVHLSNQRPDASFGRCAFHVGSCSSRYIRKVSHGRRSPQHQLGTSLGH